MRVRTRVCVCVFCVCVHAYALASACTCNIVGYSVKMGMTRCVHKSENVNTYTVFKGVLYKQCKVKQELESKIAGACYSSNTFKNTHV